jgi:AraC-like DNA-binding protein
MHYGDEHYVEVRQGFDLEALTRAQLAARFRKARRITAFHSTPDHNFIHDLDGVGLERSMCYRIDRHRMIEINDAVLKTPVVIRNRVADIISFQFVSTVKRSEFLGKRKNVHDLGPAMLVSVVPAMETTYRVPSTNVQIRHVMVHTTLSNLMAEMSESPRAYPDWISEILNGHHQRPTQRVYFLEDVHRDSIWSCFHLPVGGSLLGHWMSAKFTELLCIGLQILKNSRNLAIPEFVEMDRPSGEKISRARTILGMEYANPPAIPKLARQLGLSETRLKSGFKAMHGTTLRQYCIDKRIEAARFLLKENRHTISEVGSIVGYQDHSAFSRAFRRHCGYSPREWRRHQSGDAA